MEGEKLSSQNDPTFFAHMTNCLKSAIYKQADMVNIATRDLITIKTIALGDKTICDLVNRLI